MIVKGKGSSDRFEMAEFTPFEGERRLDFCKHLKTCQKFLPSSSFVAAVETSPKMSELSRLLHCSELLLLQDSVLGLYIYLCFVGKKGIKSLYDPYKISSLIAY